MNTGDLERARSLHASALASPLALEKAPRARAAEERRAQAAAPEQRSTRSPTVARSGAGSIETSSVDSTKNASDGDKSITGERKLVGSSGRSYRDGSVQVPTRVAPHTYPVTWKATTCGSGTQALITVESARVTMTFSDPSSAGCNAGNYLLTRSGPVTPVSRKIVLGSSLLIGYVVMAFEMILGHYLNPYFGSSIFTWGAIISTVLIALGVGYFWGGVLADRRPHGSLIGTLLCASAAYLALIPFVADAALLYLVTRIEDIRVGALAAALLLSAPLTLLGMYCPFAVRLTTTDGKRSGITAGRVYGISTVGSVVGTLSVAFFLVLYMGSRSMTLFLATVTCLTGVANIMFLRRQGEESERS